jgi:hypothetical protein
MNQSNENPLITLANENEAVLEVEIEPSYGENVDQNTKGALCRYLASSFVRKDGKYFDCAKPDVAMSMSDLKRVAVHRIKADFPNISMSHELWKETFQHAVETVHDDETQTIPVWNSRVECRPDVPAATVFSNGTVSINSWQLPEYRSIEDAGTSLGMLEGFLDQVFKHEVDRTIFLDWLAYSLQNEADKPAWSIVLFSRAKGTGKSTLCTLVRKLFGEENSISLNGVSKLTGRFNRTVMTKKLVVCEEVVLKPGTDQGNTVKTLISEKDVAVEGKGKEVEGIQQVCTFLFTTNHYPHWIEGNDRRFFVIDCDHDGHASGPGNEHFREFMAAFYRWMNDARNLAELRNALLARTLSNSFNPQALNTAEIQTPIMERLRSSSREALEEALIEMLHERNIYAKSQMTLSRIALEELRINPNRLPHFMESMGWSHRRVKFGGVDYARVVWVHPDYQVSKGRVLGPNGYDEPLEQDLGVEIV